MPFPCKIQDIVHSLQVNSKLLRDANKIVVVGAGKSAMDLLISITKSQTTSDIYWTARSFLWFVRREASLGSWWPLASDYSTHPAANNYRALAEIMVDPTGHDDTNKLLPPAGAAVR